MLEIFRTYYGPMNRAFAALDTRAGEALEKDVLGLIARMNRAGAESLVVPSEYLEVVVTRR